MHKSRVNWTYIISEFFVLKHTVVVCIYSVIVYNNIFHLKKYVTDLWNVSQIHNTRQFHQYSRLLLIPVDAGIIRWHTILLSSVD